MSNRNAAIGREAERLFCKLIQKDKNAINIIRDEFSIQGEFQLSEVVGQHGGKCDVRLFFTCSATIDVSIKAYSKAGFNQLTRATLENFQKAIPLDITELEKLFANKARRPSTPLFPLSERSKWKGIFYQHAKDMVKWSLAINPEKEILALYNRDQGRIKLYKVTDLLNLIGNDTDFTPGGNLVIGNCIQVQRKGGNGIHAAHIPKTNPSHPGNNIQVKLDITAFLSLDIEPILCLK